MMKPPDQKTIKLRRLLFVLIPVLLIFVFVFFSGAILRQVGTLIVVDEKPLYSDAVVVLFTGVEYYPRLMQAADIYRRQLARKVVINGNRKSEILRELEDKGYKRCCVWYADSVRILTMLGVAGKDIIWISAEDVYDTVSEAEAVGSELIRMNFSHVIIATSKFHTRRAKYTWTNMYQKQLNVQMVSAEWDPYDPDNWWKDGRQIRWVMAEYGAWIYYWWKRLSL